jgi:small neutral amino acid transporter SnatA (MarC family)
MNSDATIRQVLVDGLYLLALINPISKLLSKYNILGALIRITGIIVMTIGTQMALDGLAAWKNAV